MRARMWTVATAFSVLRIFLVIPCAYCLLGGFPNSRLWAAVILVLGVATDFLDGYLARRLHQVTEFGKIIDPLADKIAVGVLCVVLYLSDDLPLWYIGVVLVRDLLIVIGGLYIRGKKKIVVQSNLPGKITVNFIAAVLLLSILRTGAFETLRSFFFWGSVVMMIASFLLYLQRLFIGPKSVKV